MIIKSIQIENYRCIEKHKISFDQVTSFIGPNGAGKSTVLRALEWFFNGPKDSLSHFDIYGADEQSSKVVGVTVEFSQLTDGDRNVLTDRYAPPAADSFIARREWGINTTDKLTGSTLAFAPFAPVRALVDGAAGPFVAAYQELVVGQATHGVDLPDAKSKAKVLESIASWEAAHPDQLTDEFVVDSHMFGIAGQGELARIFRYVFVDADLRASDESEDSSKTVISRVLGHALDRSTADAALKDLADEVSAKHDEINATHLGPALDAISEKLSAGVRRFTVGRQVKLAPRGSEYVPPKSKVDVAVWDNGIKTKMASQGHGFQRAVLISSLQVLAEYSGSAELGATLFLAIEEPELFQHPNQARAFAAVLRELAAQATASTQVAYATHSPYFVDPVKFQEVRRVTKSATGQFTVTSTTREVVTATVAPQQSAGWDINSTWSNVILKDLREALFASAVVLCEGPDDAAVLLGASRHTKDFNSHGVSVASAGGKNDLYLAHAVLNEFRIPVLTVFDNDSDMASRMIAKKKQKSGNNRELTDVELSSIHADAARHAAGFNQKICAYFGLPPQEYPVGALSDEAYAISDTLESALMADWPEMLETKDAVVKSGLGSGIAKHSATYQLAAEKCATPPTGQIAEIIDLALRLVD